MSDEGHEPDDDCDDGTFYDDGTFWDDEEFWGPAKEEPDCGACNDSGVIYRESSRRCRSCRPTRLEAWWSRVTWRYREWRFRRRVGANAYDEEPPF